jgi:hypothetical protein
MICSTSKKCYLSTQAALEFAEWQKRTKGDRQYPYRCPICGFFHLSATRRSDAQIQRALERRNRPRRRRQP